MRSNTLIDLGPGRPRERPASAFPRFTRDAGLCSTLAVACALWLSTPAMSRADDVPAAAPAATDQLPSTEHSPGDDPLPDRPYGRPQAVRPHGQSLDYRVKLLATELGLDAGQQVQVRKVLEDQRQQMKALWADTGMPAGQRVNATRAISDRTADRIRALLNEEQRKKYIAERKPRAAGDDAGKPDVEHWMDATRPK
jgi:hypothetical protein